MSKTNYNQNCFDGLKKVEPNVSEYWYQFGDKDFKTLLTKAHNDGVDALVTIPIDPEMVVMFKELNDLGYPIKIMCSTASECIYPAVTDAVSPKTLEGTLGAEVSPTNLFSSDFAKELADYKKSNPSSQEVVWGAKGYDDVMIIAKAMQSCEPGQSSCLAQALANVKDYKSPIETKGFVGRVEQMNTRIQMYQSGKWIDVK